MGAAGVLLRLGASGGISGDRARLVSQHAHAKPTLRLQLDVPISLLFRSGIPDHRRMRWNTSHRSVFGMAIPRPSHHLTPCLMWSFSFHAFESSSESSRQAGQVDV